jgi:hypothetical protein
VRDCGGSLAGRGIARGESRQKPEGPDNNERNGEDGRPRQSGTEVEEDPAYEESRTEDLDEIVRPRIQKTLDLMDILVQNRHQTTGSEALKLSGLEPLEVFVRLHPELVLEVLGEISPTHRCGVLGDRFDRPDENGENREEKELLDRIDETYPSQEGFLPIHDHVHRDPDQDLRKDIEDLVQNRVDRCPPPLPSPLSGIAQELLHGVDRRHGR